MLGKAQDRCVNYNGKKKILETHRIEILNLAKMPIIASAHNTLHYSSSKVRPLN